MDERTSLLSNNRHHLSTPSPRCTQLACVAILIVETCERIAFYGIVGNLVLFLNEDPLHWTTVNAANALFFFAGFSYITSVLGGWLADSYLGRFKTMVLFFIVYIIGYTFMPFFYFYPNGAPKHVPAPNWCTNQGNASMSPQTSVQQKGHIPYSDYKDGKGWQEICSWEIFLALSIIAIGTGSVKANIAPFGADQIKHEGLTMMRAFFNWYYWCINAGALLSLGVLAYIQQEISFFWGYVCPEIFLILALFVFIAGCRTYIIRPPSGSVITNVGKICYESCKRRSFRPVSNFAEDLEEPTPGCLDMAKIRYGGSYTDAVVDDVKQLGKIFVIFLSLIPYWLVYFQMQTTFQVQGMHMRLDFKKNTGNKTVDACDQNNFKIPSAWLSLFDVIFLIILIPIMDRVVYPKLDARGYHLSLRARIVIGMIFGILSICMAGVLETYRLSAYWKGNKPNPHWQCIGNTVFRAADLSILCQIPQYALIGISEVFASVAGLEMAYRFAPRSMQGSIMGLFWFTQGIGSLMGSVTLELFRNVWFFSFDHGDINCRIPCPDDKTKICHECHLNYYFFVLGGVQALGLLLFIILTWRLKIGQSQHSASSPSANQSNNVSNGVTTNGAGGLQQSSDPNRNAADPVA